jgi:hypothetical protein
MDTKFFSEIKLRSFIHYMFGTGNFYFSSVFKVVFYRKNY